jgi:RNA polymerase sigma factor (sigma-70 family)
VPVVYWVMMKKPFDVVVAQHGATVLRVCRAVLARFDADDAWSETFLAALRAYPELPDDANVEAWLVTIAHRKTIDATRAQARRAIPIETPPEPAVPVGDPPADHDELWTALRALPDKQRRAVAYHHVGGMPYAEVAALLGGSPDAARRAAADGIATLRRRYPRTNQSLNRGETR